VEFRENFIKNKIKETKMIPKFRVWDEETKSMWNIERWHVEDE
jgi:hypothetical protein